MFISVVAQQVLKIMTFLDVLPDPDTQDAVVVRGYPEIAGRAVAEQPPGRSAWRAPAPIFRAFARS